jgi:hypothetical protein
MTDDSKRKKAARSKQARTPGMGYTRARNQAISDHVRAETLRELGEVVQGWEAEIAYADETAARIGSEPQPSFHPHVRARFDGYGALTALSIDQQALADHSPSELSQIITDVLGRTSLYAADLMMAKIPFISRAQSNDQEGIFTEASRTGAARLAVDGKLRVLWCEIAAEASGWPADVLGERIMRLYNAAALRAAREIVCQLDDPEPSSDADRPGQFAGVTLDEAAVAQYRAAALCF